MARKKDFAPVADTRFSRSYSMSVSGFEVARGDIIKVKGEHGIKFKFDYLVTNTETGAIWVDCFETHRGTSGVYRSFYVERIKRVPKRGKRSKRVV